MSRRLASALFLLAALATPARSDDSKLAALVDAWAKPLVDRGELSGQLLIARGGKVVCERSYGLANREKRAPMTPETRLNIASVTKPMTVRLALQAMENNTVGYRDSIARWLPEFPHANEITIEQLLRHRSGIPHEILPDSLATQPRTAAQMVELAAKLPLDFPPGTKGSYSSGGFTVLARILELASGQSYDSLLTRELLHPLGMSHSDDATSRVALPGRAACYVPGPKGIALAPYQDFSAIVGAGSVWSTARDIDQFVQAVVGGKLGEAMRQSFLRSGKLDFNGRTSGFNSFATLDSASGLEVVWLGNVASGAPDLLKRAVPRLAAGETVPPPAFPALAARPPGTAELARYEGKYALANGVKLHLQVRGGVLWANEWILQPTAEGDFFSPRDYGRIRGVAGDDGKIARLDWTQNGEVYPAPRVTTP